MRAGRFCTFCLAFSLLLGAAGCGPAGEDGTAEVEAALDQFRAVTSFTATQVSQREETVTVDGETQVYSGTSEMAITLVTAPKPQMMSATTITLEYQGERMEQSEASYIVPEGTGYWEYYTDGTAWYKVFAEDENALAGADAADVIDIYLAEGMSYRKVGADELDSGSAVRYEATLEGEALVELLEANGLLSGISSMSENQQTRIKEDLAENLDGVTVSIWVDEATGYPARLEVSLTEILDDIADSINETLGGASSDANWLITKYTISMVISDCGAVNEIVPPPESADAQVYDPDETT